MKKRYLLSISTFILIISFSLVKSNKLFIQQNTAKKPAQNIKTTKIGEQIWMAENLNTVTFRNGDTIPEVQDPFEWSTLKTPAWCYFDNIAENGPVYGKLYNWYAVNDPRGLAPEGWHVPTDAEWKQLINALGGDSLAGIKMKSTTAWKDNGNGNNSSGFNGMPGGYRLTNGKYDSVGSFDFLTQFAYFWSCKEAGSNTAYPRILSYNNKSVSRIINTQKSGGMSVRCVKNQ